MHDLDAFIVSSIKGFCTGNICRKLFSLTKHFLPFSNPINLHLTAVVLTSKDLSCILSLQLVMQINFQYKTGKIYKIPVNVCQLQTKSWIELNDIQYSYYQGIFRVTKLNFRAIFYQTLFYSSMTMHISYLKLVSSIFYQIFIFNQMIALQKL